MLVSNCTFLPWYLGSDIQASSKLVLMFYVYDRSTDVFNSSDISPRYIVTNQEGILVLEGVSTGRSFLARHDLMST